MRQLTNWKNLRVGDKVLYAWDEFDGKGSMVGKVVQVDSDHAIVRAKGQTLWLDDDTADMFYI